MQICASSFKWWQKQGKAISAANIAPCTRWVDIWTKLAKTWSNLKVLSSKQTIGGSGIFSCLFSHAFINIFKWSDCFTLLLSPSKVSDSILHAALWHKFRRKPQVSFWLEQRGVFICSISIHSFDGSLSLVNTLDGLQFLMVHALAPTCTFCSWNPV